MFPRLLPVTRNLLIANGVAYLLQLVLSPVLELWLALWPVGHGFMPWQLLSYAFLHGGVFHLLFNMFGLWMFGSELERLWGGRRYIHFLLASTLAAALVQLVWTQLIGSNSATVGASGALYGLLLGFGMLFPNRTIQLLIPPIPMPAKVYVAVFGGLELLLGLSGPSGVAHFAHLGGMLGGFLMIQYWRGRAPFSRKR